MSKLSIDEIKNNLTIDQVFDLVAELGGEPTFYRGRDIFISKTICHNPLGQGSKKLYYYDNTKLFKCFTSCNETFDIFQLVTKVMTIRGKSCSYTTSQGEVVTAWSLYNSVSYVANFFGLEMNYDDNNSFQYKTQDWDYLQKCEDISKLEYNNEKAEFRIFNKDILKFYPRPEISPWLQEGISADVMKDRGICFNPVSYSILIPHYDDEDNLIGIRERTLIKENEQYGKYKPAILNRVMYNHPLGFALYNLNKSKKNIAQMKTAIVVEGEKSCLQYASYFGIENDISCATCGSSLISHQFNLLRKLGVEEIVVGFDKQFKEVGDDESKIWIKKLEDIHKKYSPYCKISFLFDKGNLLGYKESPLDRGPQVFMELFKERVML